MNGIQIITPPTNYAEGIPYHQQRRPWRKGWAKRWHLFGLYLYISNVRMKKRPKCDLLYTGHVEVTTVRSWMNLTTTGFGQVITDAQIVEKPRRMATRSASTRKHSSIRR